MLSVPERRMPYSKTKREELFIQLYYSNLNPEMTKVKEVNYIDAKNTQLNAIVNLLNSCKRITTYNKRINLEH